MLKQPPDCFRACWLGCGSLPGWCSWSVNIIIYQQPSHHPRVPLILLFLLLLCCGVVFLLCTALILILHLHTTIHTRLSRPACAAYLNPADLIHTPTLLRKTVGAPRPLLEQLRKRSVRPFALPQCSLSPPIRTPLIKIPPSQRFFHLPRHRLHHHLTVTLTLLPAPAVSRAFLFSPRTRHISRTPLS